MYVEVITQRDGKFWVGSTPNVKGAFVQVRRLEQVEEAMREVLTMLFSDKDVTGWRIAVRPVLHGRPARLVDVARWLRDLDAEVGSLTTNATAAAAHELRAAGFAQRDIGRLLNLSFQRVSQLLTEVPTVPTMEELRNHVRVLDASLAGIRKVLDPEEQRERVHA